MLHGEGRHPLLGRISADGVGVGSRAVGAQLVLRPRAERAPHLLHLAHATQVGVVRPRARPERHVCKHKSLFINDFSS